MWQRLALGVVDMVVGGVWMIRISALVDLKREIGNLMINEIETLCSCRVDRAGLPYKSISQLVHTKLHSRAKSTTFYKDPDPCKIISLRVFRPY